jgi:hypothetical protein
MIERRSRAVPSRCLRTLGLYGWRMMRRSNAEVAALLEALAGQGDVTPYIQGGNVVSRVTCSVVRVEGGVVVVDYVHLDAGLSSSTTPRAAGEQVFPLAAISEVRQGDSHWGPW